MASHIMIVEDEPAVARGVQVALEREGYAVTVIPTGEEALSGFADIAPDLVVLDVRLPGIDGFEVLRQLRRETRAPVLFLTARSDEVDKVVGLEIGADDYLVKPFSVRELASRVKALLRRAYGELADTQTGRTLRRGELVIDLERRRVTRDGERIGLTTTEFDLLRHQDPAAGAGARLRGARGRRAHDQRPHQPYPREDRARSRPAAVHQDRARRRICVRRGLTGCSPPSASSPRSRSG
jgi:DNA-binding response OmpR family regulator